MLKWKGKSGCRTKCNVVSYRKALDSLNPCDVSANMVVYSMKLVDENGKSVLIVVYTHRSSGYLTRIWILQPYQKIQKLV